MDYKELLKKYMYHVGQEEGTDFLTYKPKSFTQQDWEDIKSIIAEIENEQLNQL